MKSILPVLLLYFSCGWSQGYLEQHFDGADTIPGMSVFIELDTTSANVNVWQIGPPQKAIFDNASTIPNVIVTDTIGYLPDSVECSFTFKFGMEPYWWAILAIEWEQQLDLDTNLEIGKIEISEDGGPWTNVFLSDYYNFYGYLPGNEGVHHISGEPGFTGRDTIWRDIWLCYDGSTMTDVDTLEFRFTAISDTAFHGSEGWMIDNIFVHETWFHTLVESSAQKIFKAYPTITAGPVTVVCQKPKDTNYITQVELIDVGGRVVRVYHPKELNFELDFSSFPQGRYNLKIITDAGFDICPVVIER